MVSVIVPVYKVEKYLKKCVESIRQQSYSNLEIILVDDGSPDKCGQMCDEFAKGDSRIKVLHKKNGGLADARNAGIEKASGEYLLFVDSDDWIHPMLVEKTLYDAQKHGADVVVFDYVSVEESGKNKKVFSLDLPEGMPISAVNVPQLICQSCSACNKLFRKSFWDKMELKFPEGRHYEDLGTIPKAMGIAERVVYRKEVLYYYLQRTGSIMHNADFEKSYKDRVAMLEGVLMFYKERMLYEMYKQELDFLVFEHAYFVPSKEIVLDDRKSPYLKRFREYAEQISPNMYKNSYISDLSKKDKILYGLLKKRLYGLMLIMSKVRKVMDILRR